MIILISLISCNQRHTTSPLCGARVVFMRFVEYEIINLISLMPIYFLLIKIIVHSHGLRPCRSGKPRQGIIPCTLSASPADGRKGREIPCLSISQHPSVSLRQVLPDRYAVSVLPLDFVPAPQPNPLNSQPTLTRFHQAGLFPALLPLLRIVPMPLSHRQI